MENEQKKNIKVVDAYSSESQIVTRLTFVDEVLTKQEHFKVEEGRHVPYYPQEGLNKYVAYIDSDNPQTQTTLEIKNLETGDFAGKLDLIKQKKPIEGVNLDIKAVDETLWDAVFSPVKNMSDESKKKLKSFFDNAEKCDAPSQKFHVDLVEEAIENILAEQENIKQIPSIFFKTVSNPDEFGIERFIFDRMYHLPDLIEKLELKHSKGTKYIARSEKKDSAGNSIKFEHRFMASCDEEADKLFTDIARNQMGKWQKIFLACWALGNEKKQFTYSCSLTEIMKKAFPDRNDYFGGNQKFDFYEDLKSLEQTQFVFSKIIKRPKRKNDATISYNLPLIAITHEIRHRSGDKYPEKLIISLRPFDPEPHKEKIYHVGASVKKATLELHADDTSLASWIQSRKAQNSQATYISIDRDFLMKVAGLQKTNGSNRTVANRCLIRKFNKLVEKGIVIEAPKKIGESVQIRVR